MKAFRPTYITLSLILCLKAGPLSLSAQENFFLDDWTPRTIETPNWVNQETFSGTPGTVIHIDAKDTISKISPNLFGYCLNIYYGNYYSVAPLLQNIRNLDGSVYRIPVGSGSNYYFWDRASEDGIPPDADLTKMKVGIGSSNYMSLDNYYRLIYDSLRAQSMIVINYSYARYGTSVDPVAVAAGYAADWVRHDNGKTRYWEIGNENYGSWEEGYQIDTNKNQDAQPEYQTGKLYGQHFRIFADSMRKAAAETGSEIKIGAVGYWGTLWPGSRAEWNKQMIPECGSICDFVSIHQYFKGSGTAGILESATTMDEGPEQIYQWFDKESIPRVPIALSEWNLDKDRNAGCLNGMHAVIGLKNMVTSGIGMATRWNLVWNYNEGTTHGHLSTNRDYGTEGNSAWGPRAVFYYLYYARRFMGDIMIRESIEGSDQIESLATTFSSGQVGMVILNRGDQSENVSVNMSGFDPESRYYWYELRGEKGDPYSEKVYVNDLSNGSEYRVGGPAGYEAIPARSKLIREGINITAGPFTTNFILVDGAKVLSDSIKNVSFKLFGQDHPGEFHALNAASVVLGSQVIISDSLGHANFEIHPGLHTLAISKNGYTGHETQLTVLNDTLIFDTLQARTHQLTLFVREKVTNSALEGCTIRIGNLTMLTDQQGMALFSSVPELFSLELSKENYVPVDAPDHEIHSDTTLILHMEKERFLVSFSLSDRWSGLPLWNARIVVGSDTTYTDNQGNASLSVPFGSQSYTLYATDYQTVSGILAVGSDSVLYFFLEPSYANVKFKLAKESTPVNKAGVTINDSTLISNALGIATFSALPVSFHYDYKVTREGYHSVEGNFYLRTDTVIQVEMKLQATWSLREADLLQTLKTWPNPTDNFLFMEWPKSEGEATLIIFDAGGRFVKTEKAGREGTHMTDISGLNAGIYTLRIQTEQKVWIAKFVK